MDVSGGGSDNDSPMIFGGAGGRNAALAAGVDTIDSQAILDEADLAPYYQNNVGGGGGFLRTAATFGGFAGAIEAKLVKEVHQTPEAAALALVGLALAGAGFARRQARKA